MKYISLAALALISAKTELNYSIGEVIDSPNDVIDVQAVSELHAGMLALSEEKAERAKKLRDKINERESSPANQRLYFLIN
jgi:hypothetical protein